LIEKEKDPLRNLSQIAWKYARWWCIYLLFWTLGSMMGIAGIVLTPASSTPSPVQLFGALWLLAWPIPLFGLFVRLHILRRRTTKRRCLRCNYPLAKGRSGCSECGEDFWWERDRSR